MAYTPTTWVTGDTITATKLNNIESGVQSVSSSYTPTTWANGDIITAVKLNNIEQGIANASGGSSDFSTAEVTVVNNCAEGISIAVPVPSSTPMDVLLPTTYAADNSSSTITVALYKGASLCVFIGETSFVTDVSCTGNIQFIQGAGFLITGNGTITIS